MISITGNVHRVMVPAGNQTGSFSTGLNTMERISWSVRRETEGGEQNQPESMERLADASLAMDETAGTGGRKGGFTEQ
jgi:hypothetical protein